MLKLAHHITTTVRSITQATPRIRLFELADPDDWDLPAFKPGAHIDVRLANAMVRSYSLCGDAAEANRYRIAVLREPTGRGGSVFMHDHLREGDILPVSLPRNRFPLAPDAARLTMIAGGIGITPFLPMMHALRRDQRAFALHFCVRSVGEAPFLEHLNRLCPPGSLHLYFSRQAGVSKLDLRHLLRDRTPDEHVYCCGPARLIDAVLNLTQDRDPNTVHVERFGASDRPAHANDGRELIVELYRSGREIRVLPQETILQALRSADVAIDSSCEAGVCTSCKVRYLAGSPVHRDLVLTTEDRRQFMLPCVSGCADSRLVLDL
jgi:ferredoxin-NADP reductase